MERTGEQFETATFAAGCFWGVEELYRHLPGVVDTMVGYTGGHFENPTYRDVCNGKTGHAEAVQVIYDPKKISFQKLLDVFWENHDPTQLNRQGQDEGAQYRSVIFYHSPEQQRAAAAAKRELEASGKYDEPIVTEIKPAAAFHRAEEHHQQYLEKNGLKTCRV
jgi:peptide-methionine (S)-S-oxide reductase